MPFLVRISMQIDISIFVGFNYCLLPAAVSLRRGSPSPGCGDLLNLTTVAECLTAPIEKAENKY